MLTKKENFKILFFFLIIIAIIIVQYFLSESLQQISSPMIKFLQKDEYLVSAMHYVSALGSKRIKSLMMIFIFGLCNIYHSFIYTVVCYTSILLCSWLKIILQEPRPFWLDDDIKSFDCESGYGYPSNHVLTSVPSILMFFEILYYHFEVDRTVNARIFYWIGIMINTLICVSLGFSRMVLGVHSLDQVFFGLVMGFASYYFYLHIIDYDIRNYHPFLHEMTNAFQQAKTLFIFFSLYALFLVNVMLANIHYDPIWSQRILKDCGKLPTMTPFYKCLSDSGDYFCLFGAVFGIMYDMRKNYTFSNGKLPMQYIFENISDDFLTHPLNKENRIGKWNDTKPLVTILRCILIYGIFTAAFYITRISFGLFDDNILTFFILAKMIPCMGATFVVFAFGKKICTLLHLANPNIEKIRNKGI